MTWTLREHVDSNLEKYIFIVKLGLKNENVND